jgi:hypothetical protein
MRCPSCGKFASFDTEVEPEEQDTSFLLDENMVLATATYRRVLVCADCSEELKDNEFEFEGVVVELALYDDPEAKHEAAFTECDHEDVEVTFSAEPSTDTQRTDRKGKAITNPRYRKTLYGVDLTVEANCPTCGAQGSATERAEVQASSFNELV